MEYVVGTIGAALIAGPLMLYLSRFGKQNTFQHAKNMEVLSRVEKKVDRLDEKVDRLDTKVFHVDSRIGYVDTKVNDIHDRVNSLEKPKETRSKIKSV